VLNWKVATDLSQITHYYVLYDDDDVFNKSLKNVLFSITYQRLTDSWRGIFWPYPFDNIEYTYTGKTKEEVMQWAQEII
jgi:hypothetical protein